MNVSLQAKFLIVLLVLQSVGFVYLLLRSEEKTVFIDSKLIISEMITKNANKSDELAYVDRMSVCLGDTIDRYAQKHKVIILPKQASIAGGKDVTQQIQQETIKRCISNA